MTRPSHQYDRPAVFLDESRVVNTDHKVVMDQARTGAPRQYRRNKVKRWEEDAQVLRIANGE